MPPVYHVSDLIVYDEIRYLIGLVPTFYRTGSDTLFIYKHSNIKPIHAGMKGLPGKWREDEEFLAAYEEGGQSIGRALMYNPEKEAYFWSLLGGIGLWPRWYLKGFKAMYRSLHPREANTLKVRNRRRNKRKRDILGM